jgi:hypothetical protein
MIMYRLHKPTQPGFTKVDQNLGRDIGTTSGEMRSTKARPDLLQRHLRVSVSVSRRNT